MITASANAMSQSWPMTCSTPVPSPCGQARTARSRIASSRRRRAASASTCTTTRWIWDFHDRGDRPCHGPSASATLASTSASTCRAKRRRAARSPGPGPRRGAGRSGPPPPRPAWPAARSTRRVASSTSRSAAGLAIPRVTCSSWITVEWVSSSSDGTPHPRSTPASSARACRGAVGGHRGHQPQLLHLDRGDPPDRRAQPHDPAHAPRGVGCRRACRADRRSPAAVFVVGHGSEATDQHRQSRRQNRPGIPLSTRESGPLSLWTTTRSAAGLRTSVLPFVVPRITSGSPSSTGCDVAALASGRADCAARGCRRARRRPAGGGAGVHDHQPRSPAARQPAHRARDRSRRPRQRCRAGDRRRRLRQGMHRTRRQRLDGGRDPRRHREGQLP